MSNKEESILYANNLKSIANLTICNGHKFSLDLSLDYLSSESLTYHLVRAVYMWLQCAHIHVFDVINVMPRVIFNRIGIIRMNQLSWKLRVEELVSLYASIISITSSASDGSSGILSFFNLTEFQCFKVIKHPDAKRNEDFFRRKLIELSGIILYLLGDITEMKSMISESISIREPPVKFTLAWMEIRSKYKFWQAARTHFIAVATEKTPALENLLYMAAYAGLDIQIVGLGRTDFSWKNKLVWIQSHIKSRLSTSSTGNCSIDDTSLGPAICANDVVVVIDAYDIVLTLAARRLGRLLYSSPTPIIFCAEIAAYPNYAYAYAYPSQRGYTNRYLNGGCYMGPVEYITTAVDILIAENSINRVSGEKVLVLADDQYEWSRFYLERPYYISTESAQQHMVCVFRTGLSISIHWSGTLSLTKLDGIGFHKAKLPSIVHFNADIKTKYEMLISNYFMLIIRQIMSELELTVNKNCLEKLWEYWDNADHDFLLQPAESFNAVCGLPPSFRSSYCRELYNCFERTVMVQSINPAS
jgi:hypothetical protein